MSDLTTDLWDMLVAAGRAQQADVDKKIVAGMEFDTEETDS